MRARTWLLAASLSMAVPAPALAQAPDVRVGRGRAVPPGPRGMTSRDWKRALELLRQSQTVDPGRGKLLNIAICEEELGRVASALAHLRGGGPAVRRGSARRHGQGAHRQDHAPCAAHPDPARARSPRPGRRSRSTARRWRPSGWGGRCRSIRESTRSRRSRRGHAIRTYDLLVGEGARSVFTVAPDRLDAPLPRRAAGDGLPWRPSRGPTPPCRRRPRPRRAGACPSGPGSPEASAWWRWAWRAASAWPGSRRTAR